MSAVDKQLLCVAKSQIQRKIVQKTWPDQRAPKWMLLKPCVDL